MLLDHAKQSAADALKTIKELKLVTKLLTELRKSQTVHHRIIQEQLQKDVIKKYFKKDMYL